MQTRRLIPLGALSAALASLALAAPASASHSQVTFFDASNQLAGQYGAASRTRALDEMAALGVDVVRFEVYWRQVAPSADQATPPAGFNPRDPLTYGANGANWEPIDTVVKGAEARGMKVALTLTGSPPAGRVPKWASQDPGGNQSDPSPAAFGDFAYAVGKRYGGGPGSVGNAGYVSIWNEPNSPTFLRAKAGQGPAQVVALYRNLVVAGQQGLAAAGFPGRILAGELGPVAKDRLRDPLNFTRAVLCVNRHGKRVGSCPALDVSGWSHHPYLFSRPPFLKPFGGRQISFANLGQMQKVVNQARRAGTISRSAQFYVTEYGFPSRPDAPIGVPRREQAEFIAIAEYLAYNNPGLASYAQYLLRDDPRGSASYGFASGLCPASVSPTLSGAPGSGVGCKPAYGSFRTPLVVRERSAKRVTIWGHVRPANGATTVRIRFRDGGGAVKPLRTVATNAAGYFQFAAPNKAGRTWGVAWGKLKGPLVRAFRF
jgi:hypothetical protein